MTIAASQPTFTAGLEDPQVPHQLQASETRLVDRYRDRQWITADRVRHALATISYRFGGAPVRLSAHPDRARGQFELDH